MKKGPTKPTKSTQAKVRKKNQHITFENVQLGSRPHVGDLPFLALLAYSNVSKVNLS